MGGRVVALLLAGALAAGCTGSGSSLGQTPTTGAAPAAWTRPETAPAAGTGPVAGSAEASALAGAVSPAVVAANWPGYHNGGPEYGYASGFPVPTRPALAWRATLDGAVYGQPIVVNGTIIAATEHDTVYGLNPATGAVRWSTHVGTPVPLSSLPCGNIDPLGITSTPVYDAVTGSVFVVAEVTGPKHTLFALDPATGAVRWSRGVDLSGDLPSTHQQRAALLVANNRVYIGFGGLAGDCGQYKGEIVGVATSGGGPILAYRVPVRREGAIWSSGAGPVADAAGHIYASIGNGSSTTTYDGSDSVVELTAGLVLLQRFAPTTWASDNLHDLDLGSMAPALVSGGFVFIAGKSGRGYVLRQGHLGGIGGQVSSAAVCAGFGGAVAFNATLFVPCSNGIRRVNIDSTGHIHLVWRTTTGATGSPVYGGGVVWAMNISTGVLFVLASRTGAALAQVPIGAVPHFASPSLWNGLVLVGTMHGVAAVRAAP